MAAIVADAAVPVIGLAGEMRVIPGNDAWSSGRVVHAAVLHAAVRHAAVLHAAVTIPDS
jgi:hypothetical protein